LRTWKEDSSWQWRTRRTAQLGLRNMRVLQSWVLNTANDWQHWESWCTKEAKKARRKPD